MSAEAEQLREKISALLTSPVEGERAAAQSALDRLAAIPEPPAIPATGSKEWEAAKIEWARKIEFCVHRLGSKLLTPAEVKLVRNWGKSIGDPWERGAGEMLAIYKKLRADEEQNSSPIRKAHKS